MEGSALKQGPTVSDAPAIKVGSVKMRVPIYEPEKETFIIWSKLGQKVFLDFCIRINICVWSMIDESNDKRCIKEEKDNLHDNFDRII